ncbi:hypothetical protein UCREL1_2249 [Eutypa lata UCREL1]|uniref:Uncharacterized protein n=1 Tax=Eutypa lata (strain UCR-EL1) TaxID=1287681 RepID=M7TVP3_EUTLA|nr:hypothetical protein UCREL1_2249 [Eutypa lata UCREL1]
MKPHPQDIITSALGTLKDEIAHIFTGQESPEITIVSHPEHFNSSLSAAVTAAASAADVLGIVQPWRGGLQYYLTSRLAYHLNSCEGLQLESTCDLEDEHHHVLFVNYKRVLSTALYDGLHELGK